MCFGSAVFERKRVWPKALTRVYEAVNCTASAPKQTADKILLSSGSFQKGKPLLQKCNYG